MRGFLLRTVAAAASMDVAAWIESRSAVAYKLAKNDRARIDREAARQHGAELSPASVRTPLIAPCRPLADGQPARSLGTQRPSYHRNHCRLESRERAFWGGFGMAFAFIGNPWHPQSKTGARVEKPIWAIFPRMPFARIKEFS
jgi:hypothetical protein